MKILTEHAEDAAKDAIVACAVFGVFLAAIACLVYVFASSAQRQIDKRADVTAELGFGECEGDDFMGEGWRCANQTHECIAHESSIVTGKYFITECEEYGGGQK
jgi:hypothetical protein